jgi:outer membrane protein assembly factor BamB
MKRVLALLAAAVALSSVAAAVAVAEKGPQEIGLPDGYRPEGIAAGKARDIFVGSIPTGRVLEIDTKTGEQSEAVPERPDHAAIGLKYDKHANRLFVAGGPTGKAFVYDAGTGAELAAFQLTPTGQPTFINDVVLTRHVAYFTDSLQPVIYAVQRDLSGVTPIPLTGFPMAAGNNLNGIAADRTGRFLLAIQSSTGTLWRIDPATGSHMPVDLGGVPLTAGDGLLLFGQRTLLVVQNRLNQIAVVKLDPGLLSGRIARTISDPGTASDPSFDVPTTVAKKRGRLYLPNARFRPMGEPVPTEFWVTRVPFN